MIWPTDLVFDPTWPMFEVDREIVKMIILSKFDDYWTKSVASRVFTMFFEDLTYWPSFCSNIAHIQTWLKYCHDDHSENVWWSIALKLWPLECSQGFLKIWPTDLGFDLTWPIFELDRDIVKMIILSKFYDDWTKNVASRVFTMFFYYFTYWPCFLTQHHPYSHITEILSRWSFWASLMKIGPKLWHLKCSQCFSMIWTTDLVFDPTFPIFEVVRDIVKMIILSKFDDDWTKTVASRVFTMFFYDLTYWPSFWPDMTHTRTWPRYCQDDHSEHVWWRLD